jgi:hypothetical protein
MGATKRAIGKEAVRKGFFKTSTGFAGSAVQSLPIAAFAPLLWAISRKAQASRLDCLFGRNNGKRLYFASSGQEASASPGLPA